MHAQLQVGVMKQARTAVNRNRCVALLNRRR